MINQSPDGKGKVSLLFLSLFDVLNIIYSNGPITEADIKAKSELAANFLKKVMGVSGIVKITTITQPNQIGIRLKNRVMLNSFNASNQ
jgi:hypothetical protein